MDTAGISRIRGCNPRQKGTYMEIKFARVIWNGQWLQNPSHRFRTGGSTTPFFAMGKNGGSTMPGAFGLSRWDRMLREPLSSRFRDGT